MKKYKDKIYLINALKDKTIKQIASDNSVSEDTVSRAIKKYDIDRILIKYPYRNKEWLEYYLKKHEGVLSDVSKETGYKKDTLLEWCYRFNLETSKRSNAKYELNKEYFKKIDTERKAYFLGFGMADFGMAKNCYNFQFALKAEDKYIIEELAKDLNSKSNLYHYKDDIREGYSLTICSKDICRDLIYHGIVPRKSGKEVVPDTVPKNLLRHFIRGFIDGDGCIENTKRLSICSMSYNILLSIKLFLEEELEIKEYPIKPAIKESGHILYYYKIYSDSFLRVLNYLYEDATIYLNRKYLKYLESVPLDK